MDMLNFWRELPPANKRKLATSLDTSVAYLSQIANGHRKAGFVLAKAIEDATSGAVTREDLRPDVYLAA